MDELRRILEILRNAGNPHDAQGSYYIDRENEVISLAESAILDLMRRQVLTPTQMGNLAVPFLEIYFPKGKCQERGAAMVLIATLSMEIHNKTLDNIENLKQNGK